MARKDLLAMYGRIGIIVATFVLIGGVVAAPLLEWAWPPIQIVAHLF
jgi:hypothetical protein